MGAPAKVTLPDQPHVERGWSGRFALTLPQLWAAVAVTVPAMFLEGHLSTVDLAYHVRAGELMLRTHALIRTDPFSFTAAGRPWLDQQWGAQVLFAAIFRAGGWGGLALAKAGLVAVMFTLVYLACRAKAATPRLAAGLTLASFAVTGMWLPLRPQLLAMVLFAATVWIVACRRSHPRRLVAIPIIAAVWANLHGSFFLAPVVLGLAWVEDLHDRSPSARRTLGIGILSAVASLLNPFGPRVWTYAYDISTNGRIAATISEWRSPTIRSFVGAAFFASAAAIAVILARRVRPVPWPALLWLGLFFGLGLWAVRNVLWWALAAPPVVATFFNPLQRRSAELRSSLHTVIIGCLIAAGLVAFPWWGKSSVHPPESLLSSAPAGMTAELERTLHSGGRMFNGQLWGSWFEFALPGRPVFVDSRIEVYPASVWRDYQDVSQGREGWQHVLDRWNVSVVVIDPTRQAPLVGRIERDPGWRLVYRDVDGLIFERSNA